MAKLNISEPVGDIGADNLPSANRFDDTLIVQYLLNRSPGPGKPNPPLPEDGIVTPKLIAGIRDYERSRGAVDGRIDPGDSTMVALNAIALSEFEGVTDAVERRFIILRSSTHREWSFTRGDFKTLTDGGRSLTYDPSTTWLPDALKSRYLTIFNTLLKPTQTPSATWGVSRFDWFHSHLGFWSGTANKEVSEESLGCNGIGVGLLAKLSHARTPFLGFGSGIAVEKIASYQAFYAAWVSRSELKEYLESYASLPEAVIVHHTFEVDDWRPPMESTAARRNWMVDKAGALRPATYAGAAMNKATERNEFLCEGAGEICFLIDKAGVIHPVFGLPADFAVFTGFPSDQLAPPPRIVRDPLEPPPRPPKEIPPAFL